jgi:hypothetical protein
VMFLGCLLCSSIPENLPSKSFSSKSYCSFILPGFSKFEFLPAHFIYIDLAYLHAFKTVLVFRAKVDSMLKC